jgi:hypothetical protein
MRLFLSTRQMLIHGYEGPHWGQKAIVSGDRDRGHSLSAAATAGRQDRITGLRDGSPASFDRRPMAKRRLAAVRPFLAAISSGALSHPRTTLYRPEQIESLHQIKDAPLVHLPSGA